MSASPPETIELFGHDEASHDPLAKEGWGFAETLSALGKRRMADEEFTLRIPVRQRNLGFVHRVFNLALRLAGGSSGELVDAFEPRPLVNLRTNLEQFVGRMRRLSEGSSLSVEVDDDGLWGLVNRVQELAVTEVEPELLRVLGFLTEGVYIGPRTFHLDVANSCNENCAYCWFHSPSSEDRSDADQFGPEWKRTHIDYFDAVRIIDDLERMETREDILLTGKGEPLTHPRCLDIIDYIKSKDMHVTLFSNGMLLNRQNLDRMHAAGLDMLYVSLSSASYGSYEALHPGHEGAELDVVRQNLEYLRELKQKSGSQLPRVVMVDVVNHENASELAEFARLAVEVKAQFLRYQLIHVQYYNKKLMLTAEDIEAVRKGLDEARALAEPAGIQIMDNIDLQLRSLDPATGSWGRNELPVEGCLAGWYFSRSWADGNVSFCCSPKPIARVQDVGFEQLWKGATYGYYRSAGKRLEQNKKVEFSDGTKLLNSHCYSCPNYEGLAHARKCLEFYELGPWLAR